MRINLKKYAIAFYDATSKLKGDELDKATKEFISMLAQKGLMSKSGQIIGLLEDYSREKRGILKVTATTASELNTEQIDDLENKIKNHLKQEIEVVNEVDKNLVGGIVLKIHDLLIDASIKNHLQTLKQQLIK